MLAVWQSGESKLLVFGQYVPILTGKAGELTAMANLEPGSALGLTPLIDVPPFPRPHPPRPGKDPEPPKDPATELGNLLARLASRWGSDHRVLSDLDGFERYKPGGLHAVAWTADRVNAIGLRLALVVSSRSTAAYREAAVVARDEFADLVLRVHCGVDDDPSFIRDDLLTLSKSLSISPSTTDVIVDLGRLPSGWWDVDAVAEILKAVMDKSSWRSVVLASTSLPDFPTLDAVDGLPFDRRDWRLWRGITDQIGTRVAFADYGITGPRPQRDDPAFAPAPHLRYTTDQAVWVWKGRQKRDEDPGIPYPELAGRAMRFVAESPRERVFRGKSFSWGDAQIWEAGNGSRKPGNGATWISHATNHHLTQVLGQLQQL
jgi:hypothetical protein